MDITPSIYNWTWVINQSDAGLSTEVANNPDKIIHDLSQELLNNSKTTIRRESACKLLSAYKNIKSVNFKELFSALDEAHVLEDPLHLRPPSLGFFERVASRLKVINLSNERSFMGLTEDEALGKLYQQAIESRNGSLAYELITHVSDLDKAKIDRKTCLEEAWEYPSLWIPLIHRGVDVNAKIHMGDFSSMRPIQYALGKKWEEIALTLINHGINLDTDLLHVAIENHSSERIIKALLDKGIDTEILSLSGLTPLHIACNSKNKAIVRLLVEHGANVNAVDLKGNTPLHLTIIHGLEEEALFLIENGANIDSKGQGGQTPLHVALRLKNTRVASKLIEKGSDINARDDRGKTPLHLAIGLDLREIASSLIEIGASFTSKDAYGQTPLHSAIMLGHKEIALILIEKGADVISGDIYRQTPLHLAIRLGQKEIALALIEKGADISRLDFNNAKKLIKMILEKNGYPTDQLDLLDGAEDPGTLEALLASIMPSLIEGYPMLNPLFFPLILGSRFLLMSTKEILSKEQFEVWKQTISKVSLNTLEDLSFEVDPTHYAYQSISQASIPEPPPDSDIDQLKSLFDKINFSHPNEKWYRNPVKLTDEGNLVTPQDLKTALENLINRIKNQTPFMGTPPSGTPQLKQYYEGFEKLLKHITYYIKKMDPDEQATALIDVAIMGRHCGGKIGEADSMFKILSQTPMEGLEAPIYVELQQNRLGILMEWSSKSPASYQTHAYNQYMFLLAKELNLPNAEMFSREDPLATGSGIRLTKEQALQKFYKEYTPSKLTDRVQNKLWDLYKDPKTQTLAIDWIKDHMPLSWNEKLYQEIGDKLAKMEEEKRSRKEIFKMLKTDFKISLRADESPLDAIESHQEHAYMEQVNPAVDTAKEWNLEFYDSLRDELKKIRDSNREGIESFLRSKGIEIRHAMDFKDMIERHRQISYLHSAFLMNEDDDVIGISRTTAQDAVKSLGIIK